MLLLFNENFYKVVRTYKHNCSTANYSKIIQCLYFSSKSKQSSDEVLPKNVLEPFHTASQQPEKGVIYDKKPFKITLEPAKNYSWCACGQSKNQPFCDGTHKSPYLGIKLRPVRFQVEEQKDYWLCNCKQTSKRPFCDGTHKREDIQAKIR